MGPTTKGKNMSPKIAILRLRCFLKGHRFSNFRRVVKQNVKRRKCMTCGKLDEQPMNPDELKKAAAAERRAAERKRLALVPRMPDTDPAFKR